jgi:hypothetical protein
MAYRNDDPIARKIEESCSTYLTFAIAPLPASKPMLIALPGTSRRSSVKFKCWIDRIEMLPMVAARRF